MVRKKRTSAELTCTEEGCTGCDGESQPPADPAAAARLLAIREANPATAIPCADSESVLFVDRSTGLTRIKRDVVQLAVWRRPEIPPFVRALSDPSFSAADLPSFKGVVTPSDAARTLSHALRAQEGRRRDALGASGALDAGQLDALVEDVARLVGLFAKATGEEYVFVRLEALEDNGCVFWHQDCVDFRLCATYRGPCTEFVAPEWSKAVLRRRQADSKHAQSLMHTDVALFKGRGEDHDATKLLDHPGIVHRSPRIEAAGICRSVLVLDIPQPWMMQDEDSHDEDDEEDGEEEGEEESDEDDDHHH